MSLLTAKFVKNSLILSEIYFTFLQNYPRRNLEGFQYQIRTSVKRSENLYQARNILPLVCKIVALILG